MKQWVDYIKRLIRLGSDLCPQSTAPCVVECQFLGHWCDSLCVPLHPLFSCVDGMLDDILQTASETGRELDHQNVQLGRMNKKVDDADTNITGLNIRMNRQIRK